ncbi:MAG: nitroreductase family protein [Candidatus Lokiarchaeota archaeon]|nr:nitroreductase family protein [Candidatus Lokiarchaeota archaeon]
MNVKEAIEKRRAYRSLEPIQISEDIITSFKELVQLAPSCMNNQPWKFVFIQDKSILNQIFTTLSPGNKWVENASLMIGVLSKPEDDCIIGKRYYYLFDTGIATAYIILRATELGLVAHPIAGFNEEKAKNILKAPKDMRLITLINIGKKSININPILSESMKMGENKRPPRKSLDEISFRNQYGKN